jgi:hypothetical protein
LRTVLSVTRASSSTVYSLRVAAGAGGAEEGVFGMGGF